MIVWLNGRLVAAGAAIDVADRGFLLGDGAFETLEVEGGRAAFLEAHLARLRFGLNVLRIAAPPSLGNAGAIIADVARANALDGAATVRLTVTRGPGPRGLACPEAATPTMLVALSPSVAPADAPILVTIAAQRRFSRASTNGFKAVGAYLENMLALDDARRLGAEEALLLNEHGRLVCAAAANVVVVDESGEAATPPEAEGPLPGIVRGLLLRAGLVSERPIGADEPLRGLLVLTGSLKGVRAARLAGAPAPNARQLATLAALQSCYQDARRADLGGGA